MAQRQTYQGLLNSTRRIIMDQGLNSSLAAEINDMKDCTIKSIVKAFPDDLLIFLKDYLKFPTKSDGGINKTKAREVLTEFLLSFPQFASKTPEVICASIEYHFQKHPEDAVHLGEHLGLALLENNHRDQVLQNTLAHIKTMQHVQSEVLHSDPPAPAPPPLRSSPPRKTRTVKVEQKSIGYETDSESDSDDDEEFKP